MRRLPPVLVVLLLALALGPGRTSAASQARGQGAGRGQPLPPQTLKGTGLILGQVIDAATGQPIADATVTMTARPASPVGTPTAPAQGGLRAGAPNPAGPAAITAGDVMGLMPGAQRVMTDGQGRFVFHDLPKATIGLLATAPGYVTANAGQARPGAPSRPVDLDNGERVTDLKIRLWKYATVSGTVVDEAGEPAVNVLVRVLRRTAAGGTPRYAPGAAGRTDDRGMYRLSTLVPGDFIVAIPQSVATMPAALMNSVLQGFASGAPQGGVMMDLVTSGVAPNFGGGVRVGDLVMSSISGAPVAPTGDGRVFAYLTLFYPAATSTAQATVIGLGSGEERSGVDFQLRAVPTARVSGTVVVPGGTPGVIGVRLVPAALGGLASDSGLEVGTAATTTDGRFTFLGVPAGQYVAKVVKQSRPPIPAEMASSPLVQMVFGPGAGAASAQAETLYAQAAVNVAGADVTDLSLALAPGARLTGRVEFEGAAQGPVAPQLQAMTIVLSPADGAPPTAATTTDHPDVAGQFRTHGYPPGRYFVNVVGGTGAQWMLGSIIAGGRDVSSEPLELKDTDVNDVVVTFTDRVTQLAGTIRSASGVAAPDATVVLFPADYQSWIAAGMSPRRMRRALATKAGSFSLGSVQPGDYLVAAFDPAETDDSEDAAFFEALARVATRITVGEGEKKTQDLQIVRVRR